MSKLAEKRIGEWPDDPEIESRARAIFRSACAGTDSYHALRLGLARRRALDVRARRAAGIRAPLAGAAACCVLVAGLVWLHPMSLLAPGPSQGATAATAATAVGTPDADDATPEIGSSQQELVENLDFYRWLASQPSVASAPSGGAR